jgi:hypothetical protein
MKYPFRNPFRRAVRRIRYTARESHDLLEEQLDRISGGVPAFPRHAGPADTLMRIELPMSAIRPSDHPALWL